MIRGLFVVLTVVACAHPRLAEVARSDQSLVSAQSDLQSLISAGGIVRIPAGRYVVSRAGSAYYALTIPAGTTLIGESRDSTAIVLAPGTAPGVSLLNVAGAGVTVQSMTLDGNAAEQTPDEHRHGIFARASGLAIRDVAATGFTGDGIYLYSGADGAVIDRALVYGNTRNGLTFGGLIAGAAVTTSTFMGNHAQQIDSEPGGSAHVDSVTLRSNTLDGAGASNDYALTICGTPGGASRGWIVEGNVINGGLYTAWAADITVRGNQGVNATSKPSVLVYRTASAVTIDANDFTAGAAGSVIAVIGTGTGQAATDVRIAGNHITAGGAIGIRVDGAVSVTIDRNTLTNPRNVEGVAIALRATNPAAPFASATVTGNRASGWSRGLAIAGMPGTAAQLTRLTLTGNDLGGPTYLDDGSGALQAAELTNNRPADVARWPSGVVLTTSTLMTRGAQ